MFHQSTSAFPPEQSSNGSIDSDIRARLFGEGADARLAGLPLSANPYTERGPRAVEFRKAWRAGWLHCDHFWGTRNIWAPLLPPVRQESEVVS